MYITKHFILLCFMTVFTSQFNAEDVKKMGTHKDWETYIIKNDAGTVCFAQSKPVLQAPKKDSREARFFITLRPNDKISNEISVTSRSDFNTKNTVISIS